MWGGSLELYPVEGGAEVGPPAVTRSKKVDVKWGQLVFFEVQPGEATIRSRRSLLEMDDNAWVSLAGGFGFSPETTQNLTFPGFTGLLRARRATSHSTRRRRRRISARSHRLYVSHQPMLRGSSDSTDVHSSRTFLRVHVRSACWADTCSLQLPGQIPRPVISVHADTREAVRQFLAASEIVLHNFLKPDLASNLRAETESADKRDYPDLTVIPEQHCGEGDGWTLQGPTSKHRFLSLTRQRPLPRPQR